MERCATWPICSAGAAGFGRGETGRNASPTRRGRGADAISSTLETTRTLTRVRPPPDDGHVVGRVEALVSEGAHVHEPSRQNCPRRTEVRAGRVGRARLVRWYLEDVVVRSSHDVDV